MSPGRGRKEGEERAARRVPTVTGDLPVAGLGRTLVHEHLFVLGEEYRLNYQDGWTEDTMVDEAVRMLDNLHAFSIDTITRTRSPS